MRPAGWVPRLLAAVASWPRRQRGQTLVEFALILPVFLALTVCVIDVGRGVAIYNLTSEAARSGARAGRINPDPTTVANVVKAELGVMVANPSVTVNQISSGGEPYVEVTVSSAFTPLSLQVIGLTNNPLNIAATSRQYMYNVLAAGGTPFPTMTPNATAFVEATQTAQAGLTATVVASSLTATAAAGGPTPNATQTAAAGAPTPNATQTAVANATATALAALPTAYTLPNIPPITTGSTSSIADDVACGASGTLTSTIIAWSSDNSSTGLRARMVEIGTGIPSAWQNIPSTGATLNFPIAAGKHYYVEVENTGNGSASKSITVITQPVELSCPSTP